MYQQFISLLHIDMTQGVEIFSQVRQLNLNILLSQSADVLVTQGADVDYIMPQVLVFLSLIVAW